jgi:hypothetical protein
VDWNPSGGDHIFDELRTAAEVNEEEFGGAIPDGEWLKMITVNPAKALALDVFVGKAAQTLEDLNEAVLRLRVDPDNWYVHTLIPRLSGTTPRQLEAVSAGSLLYAAP